jgi:hypothetical protein
MADEASGLFAVARECGWCWLYPDVAIISARPQSISMSNGRLHSATGPAVQYADGTKCYAWNGTAVPSEWIEDKSTLAPKTALGQTNANLRAAAIQIVGWPKMIDMLDAKVVNQHPEGMLGGQLLAVKKAKIAIGSRGTMKFLRAECPRNGTICFRVPDEITTAHEAQAWKSGLPADIYKLPSIRT